MSERIAPRNPNSSGIFWMDNARVRRPLTKVVRFEQSAPHPLPVMSFIPLPAIEAFDTNNP